MKQKYNSKTKRFSLCNLTEDKANAILRSLGIIVEKMDYNEEYGFYTDRGDCFALPTERPITNNLANVSLSSLRFCWAGYVLVSL